MFSSPAKTKAVGGWRMEKWADARAGRRAATRAAVRVILYDAEVRFVVKWDKSSLECSSSELYVNVTVLVAKLSEWNKCLIRKNESPSLSSSVTIELKMDFR